MNTYTNNEVTGRIGKRTLDAVFLMSLFSLLTFAFSEKIATISLFVTGPIIFALYVTWFRSNENFFEVVPAIVIILAVFMVLGISAVFLKGLFFPVGDEFSCHMGRCAWNPNLRGLSFYGFGLAAISAFSFLYCIVGAAYKMVVILGMKMMRKQTA